MGERGAERRRGGNEIEPMAILSEHGNTWESLASFNYGAGTEDLPDGVSV